MSDLCNDKQAMLELTQNYVEKLSSIWEKIFHPDNCKENLRKLVDHTTFFYDELVSESLSRKTLIESEINQLKVEADNLKRLLKTDIQLPSFENDNVPLLIVQAELDKSLEDLREQLRLRKEQICELLLEQEALCEELGEPPRALLADPLPTEEEIKIFCLHLDFLKEERVERMKNLSDLRRDIKGFLHILELKVNSEDEDRLLNHRQIKMNKETFDDLKRMHDLYGSQVKELEKSIQAMRTKLETLWNRLNTSPNTRNRFNRYNERNQHTYDIFYDELQRCETLKRQNIKVFVQHIRDEIAKLWEKTLKSDTQKSRFSNYTSTCYSDDLLVLHEMELEDLKSFYESNKQIFDLYTDRNILWERMNALEAKASDPGRYNNRGGQLLKEEKERKTIATKLPKIEQQITDLVKAYEEKEHVPFLVYGENILNVMAAQWEQKRHEKELLQSARKHGGKAAASVTPKVNSTKTPLSMKNVSTVSSLRKTPSTISLVSNTPSTQKRKLNPAEKHTPIAKRSLMQALNSPSIFLKPSARKDKVKTTLSSATGNILKNLNKSGSSSKSPFKKTKLIATTIRRRRSGRYSSGTKKRPSAGKSPAMARAVPKIIVENCASDGYSTDYNGEDTYDSFEKCIEPTSRSSVLDTNTTASSSRTNRMKRIVDDENSKLAKLPRPRVVNHTPSKNCSSFSNHSRKRLISSPAPPASTGRKLTTKNLPIII